MMHETHIDDGGSSSSSKSNKIQTYKYLDEVAGLLDNLPRKRAKCKEACAFCRKSRTACDNDRPCQRCVKRNIGHLCTPDALQLDILDAYSRPGQAPRLVSAKQSTSGSLGVDAPLKTVERLSPPRSWESILAALESSSEATSQSGFLAPNLPDSRSSEFCSSLGHSLPISAQLDQDLEQSISGQTDAFTEWQDPVTDPLMDYIFRSVQAGSTNTTSTSNNNQQMSGLPHSSRVLSLQDGTPADQAVSWEHHAAPFAQAASPSHSSTSSITVNPGGNGATAAQVLGKSYNGMDVGEVEIRPAAPALLTFNDALDDIQPYNYTYGYALVAKHIASQPQHLQKRLSAATASFRPLLHSRLAVYTDEQQVLVEKQFKQAIHAWASFLEALPLPACLFRRTGQIQASNQKLSTFTGLSPAKLRNGRMAIYELLSPESFLEYWEAYAKGVLPALEASERFEVNLEVNIQREQAGSGAGALTSRGGVHFPCAMSCSVSFDPYGLPSTLLAIFTPVTTKNIEASVQ